jgi:hypothetical protein
MTVSVMQVGEISSSEVKRNLRVADSAPAIHLKRSKLPTADELNQKIVRISKDSLLHAE